MSDKRVFAISLLTTIVVLLGAFAVKQLVRLYCPGVARLFCVECPARTPAPCGPEFCGRKPCLPGPNGMQIVPCVMVPVQMINAAPQHGMGQRGFRMRQEGMPMRMHEGKIRHREERMGHEGRRAGRPAPEVKGGPDARPLPPPEAPKAPAPADKAPLPPAPVK